MKRSALTGIVLLISIVVILGVSIANSQTPTATPYNEPRPVYGVWDTATPPATRQLDKLHRQGAILVAIIPLPDGAGYRTYLRYESR